MALTVHYTLATRTPLTDDDVADLAARARTFAVEAEVESVSRLEQVRPDTPLAHEWVVVPPVRGGATHLNVPPGCRSSVHGDRGPGVRTALVGPLPLPGRRPPSRP